MDYFGYPVRESLFPTEHSYFKNNPDVSGMAADDKTIIFNPYSQNINKDAVGQNEAARLWLRENNVEPKFNIHPHQRESFKGTPYENNELALRHTILGRIISGDPSAGMVTPVQQTWADWLMQQLQKRNK